MNEIPPATVHQLSRRDFLKIAAGVAISGAGFTLLEACSTLPGAPVVAPDTLETTTIRIPLTPTLCHAPQWLAEDLLKAEGFTDVQYVKMTTAQITKSLVSGTVDVSMHFAPPSMVQMDKGAPIVFLAGVHVGCWKLFAHDPLQTVADLKGRSMAITELNGSEHIFMSTVAAYVGLDPARDINWITKPVAESKQLFADGKIDAFLAFPPLAQELQDKQIGHVVLNSMMDDPWSKYFCCMFTTSRDFVSKNPVASKRALRAILKASDICAQQPEKAAQLLIDKGFTDNYQYALQAMQEIPFNVWRTYDPDDTLRFYALRLREAGFIKSSPEQLISSGTNWMYLNELKAELKG